MQHSKCHAKIKTENRKHVVVQAKICSTQQRSTKLEHITIKQLEELKKKSVQRGLNLRSTDCDAAVVAYKINKTKQKTKTTTPATTADDHE